MSQQEISKWKGLFGISIAGFLGCLDLTIVNTALPAIQTSLNLSVAQLQWVMTSLLLALTTSMVISGKLADLYGRRLWLFIGMALFAVSSIAVALAPNLYFLICFRFLQGVAIAFLYTAPVAIIPSLFPEHQHGRATGLLIGANGLGLAIGPVIGGLIVSLLGWRWIFFINPPLILLSFLFCWHNIIETKSEAAVKKIDWWGFVLLLIAVPALILALVQGQNWGWSTAPIIILLVIAVLALILFYYVENKIAAPIIDFHLFANRIYLTGLATNFALALFYSVDFFLIPLYLHFIHGQTGYQIGLSLLPATAMVAVLSSVTGRMVDKKGPKVVLCLGLALFAISALLQAQFGATTSIYLILFSYLIFGIGWACILSPSIIAALSSLPKEAAGVGMGTLGTLHNLGGAIGLAVGTLIYNILSKKTLLSMLSHEQIPAGKWVDQAIANIDNALHILENYTGLSSDRVSHFFQQYFLSGYRGAMWFLVFTSLVALITAFFGLKNKS